MTTTCGVCGSEIPSREYWDTGTVQIAWFGGDEAFGTRTVIPGSTMSVRRWSRVCKGCMTRVVGTLDSLGTGQADAGEEVSS